MLKRIFFSALFVSLHGFQLYERDLLERQEEKREFNDVSWSVHAAYFSATGKTWLVVSIFIMFVLSQFAASFSDWWLGHWSVLPLSCCYS